MPDRSDGAPPTGVPTSGVARVRVRYCECDPMGVAHHAVFPVWLEIARTEVLRQSGVSYKDLEAAGVFLVVVRLDLRYRRPGRYDDVLDVHCRLTGGGGVKLEHEYEIKRVAPGAENDSEVICIASSTLACVNKEGRPQALPEWLTHGVRAADNAGASEKRKERRRR